MCKNIVIPSVSDMDNKKLSDFFKIESVHAGGGKSIKPFASVGIEINGKYVTSSGFGNGPVDAVFNVIAKLTSSKAELLKFSIGSLTKGADAPGEVIVKLSENGFIAIGKWSDFDIITASAEAYISALNKLESLKANS